MSKIDDFRAANAASPIIAGQWLDSNGRHVTRGPETWERLRYTLADGNRFELTGEELGEVQPRWGFENEFPDHCEPEGMFNVNN